MKEFGYSPGSANCGAGRKLRLPEWVLTVDRQDGVWLRRNKYFRQCPVNGKQYNKEQNRQIYPFNRPTGEVGIAGSEDQMPEGFLIQWLDAVSVLPGRSDKGFQNLGFGGAFAYFSRQGEK